MTLQEPPEDLREVIVAAIKQFVAAINSKEGEEFYTKIRDAINSVGSHDLHLMMSVMHAAMWATAMKVGIDQDEYISNTELYTKVASSLITPNCLGTTKEEKN
jgi:hypothetical protein